MEQNGVAGNVKQYDSSTTLWKDYSGNKVDETTYMMRKAQRRAVVIKLQPVVASPSKILETKLTDLIYCMSDIQN